jgi:clan AA aspartic protease (TIGR02281 family)
MDYDPPWEATGMRGAIGGIVGALAVWGGGVKAEVPVVAAPPAAAPAEGAAQTLKLAQDPTSRLTLAVMVNGKGPYEFLVDTGSNTTVISRELATSLGLPPAGKVMIRESIGSDEAATVRIDRLAIGKRVLRRIEAPAVAAKDLGAAGMLGVDALADLHVVMDFKAMRMSSSPSRHETADAHTIVVQGKNLFGELILTHSKIHGVPIVVVVDSGAQLSIGNPALLALLTRRDLGRGPRATTQVVSVTGRTLTVEMDDVAEADVGGLTIRNMALGFAPLPIFERLKLGDTPALFLGMDVLSHCQRVSVDMRRREATFTLN